MRKLPQFKIKLLNKEYTADFDTESFELILNNENELKKIDIKGIRDLKECILESVSGMNFWYVDRCIHANSDYVLFKVKYYGNNYARDIKINNDKFNKIVLSNSKSINTLLHPANYFYDKEDEANCNILYDRKIMKSFSIKHGIIEYNFLIYIGNILDYGNTSNLNDLVKIEICPNIDISIKEIIIAIENVEKAFMIIGGNKNIYFENIELYKDKKRMLMKGNGIEDKVSTITLNLYNNKILEKIISGTFNNDFEFRFLEENDDEITTLYICRLFENIMKKRKINIKRTKEEDLIVEKLINKINEFDSTSFISGLKNSINLYNNKFSTRLKWAFNKYYNYFDSSNIGLCDLYIKYLGKIENNKVSFENAIKRINDIRNAIAHDDITIELSEEDKMIIKGLQSIVYIMILEEFKLEKNEIDLFMKWNINLL